MRRFLGILIVCLLGIGTLKGEGGLPFFTNYLPATYQAHNRNFDVVGDEKGRIYVANFEGLLYYDQADWHILHAPGIFRITQLYKDRNGRIWVGGYNLFGFLSSDQRGSLELQLIFSERNKGFLGEVTDIYEEEGRICVETSIGDVTLEDDSMQDFIVRTSRQPAPLYYQGLPVNQKLALPDGITLLATAGKGLVALDREGRELYVLSEQNGLCNNNVNQIYADSLGYVWGATDQGLFLVDVHSSYTRFAETEGLLGEVQSVCHVDGRLLVGTLQGIYEKVGAKFQPVGDIHYACWQLQPDKDGQVYAATAGGLFRIRAGQVAQLSSAHTLSCFINPDGSCYTGEVDGIYYIGTHARTLCNKVEKATHFYQDSEGTLLVRNIYGQVFRLSEDKKEYIFVVPKSASGAEARYNNTLYQQGGHLYVQSHVGLFEWDATSQSLVEKPEMSGWLAEASYPQFVYPEGERLWFTNNEGKALRVYDPAASSEGLSRWNELLYPVHHLPVLAMDIEGENIWLGGSFGLLHSRWNQQEPDYQRTNHTYIRRIILDQDSILWGGFSGEDRLETDLPSSRYDFQSHSRDIRISFSSDALSALGDVEYRYRFRSGAAWSDWSTATSAHYANPRPGSYTFEVMARDRYGRETAPVSLALYVHYPFYLKWYCVVGYVLLLAIFIMLIIRLRMRRLLQEKVRLEQIVAQRTSELRQQKDKIEEKSKQLEVALDDLSKAQYELIRQEKMATVGTLTKGLVDRILNPMNYVNNFSHLSLGLIKDLAENLKEDEERMTPDIYDDSTDVLEMLRTNLQKIEAHGLNTTRILKAMEEMLKEWKGQVSVMDIAAICRKNMEMLHTYYAQEIAECGIQTEAPDPDLVQIAEVDAEQFSKTIMSILANSIYALQKKCQREDYQPLIRLTVSPDETQENVIITVYDNGIGIEESIIGKVFDPFFTTKTTSEAVGVGMYLSREIILNHGGDITVASEKDKYTQFTIIIPISQKKRNRAEGSKTSPLSP